MIHVGFIAAEDRIRGLNKAHVAALALSIKEVGLLNPITVYPRQIIRNGQQVDGYGLIAGAHRLEACMSLGMQEVPAVVVDLSEQARIIAECDENLCGSNLSPSEVAIFTAKRKAAYEALHPETRATSDGGGGRNNDTRRKLCDESVAPRFTADTATKTGKSERKVQLDAERGEKLSEDALRLIRGTRLDTGVFLDRVKKIKLDNQADFVRRELADKPTRKPPAPAEDDLDVQDRQVAALVAAWNRAGPEAREDFLVRIGRA